MLDLFENLTKIPEEKYHPKFKLLKDVLLEEKAILSDWVTGYVDTNNKTVTEFQKNFHSSFWQFYLYAVLKELNFKIDFSKTFANIIITSAESIIIDSFVSNIKENSRNEQDRNRKDILAMLVPAHLAIDFNEVLDDAIIKHSIAIHKKLKNYRQSYSEFQQFNGNEPYVIALSSYDQVNYAREFTYPMMALLFGLYYDPMTDDYIPKTSIRNAGAKTDITLGLFNSDIYEDVSAILFSCTTTLDKLTSLASSQDNMGNMNHVVNVRQISDDPAYSIKTVSPTEPEVLSDGLFLFHNPHAKNALDRKMFIDSNIVQIYLEGDQFRLEGNQSPLFSRYNDNVKLPVDYLSSITKIFNRQ